MIVTSPVGELPYRPERLSLESGRLVLHGRMGTWPAKVELDARDLGELIRLAWAPLFLVGAVLLLAAVRSRGPSRPRRGAGSSRAF